MSEERKECRQPQNFDINFEPPLKVCSPIPGVRSVIIVSQSHDKEIVVLDHRMATILAQKVYQESGHSPDSIADFMETVNNYGVVFKHEGKAGEKIIEQIAIYDLRPEINIEKISFVRFIPKQPNKQSTPLLPS